MQITHPGVKKKVEDGATLIYLDKVGFSLKGVVRSTWAPRGQTPVVRLPASWHKLSTIGAITSRGQFLQHTQPGRVKTADVVALLDHLLKHVSGEIMVVLDNLNVEYRLKNERVDGLRYPAPSSAGVIAGSREFRSQVSVPSWTLKSPLPQILLFKLRGSDRATGLPAVVYLAVGLK